jgi:plasmid stability protein
MAAMTMRLDDDQSDALRRRAEQEGRSMQQVVHEALREYFERHDAVRSAPTRSLRELLASWEPLGPPGAMTDVVALIREDREAR